MEAGRPTSGNFLGHGYLVPVAGPSVLVRAEYRVLGAEIQKCRAHPKRFIGVLDADAERQLDVRRRIPHWACVDLGEPRRGEGPDEGAKRLPAVHF